MKTQVLILAQGASLTTNPVSLCYIFLDIARSIPVPFLELVLFGVQIFFLTWDGDIFAELESAVDSVDRRKRRSEHSPNQKGGTSSGLQKRWQNVRSTRKEIP